MTTFSFIEPALRRRFDDSDQREALRVFLISVADWIDESLTRQRVLTVYGI